MRTSKRLQLHILIWALLMLLVAFPVFAENEEPLTLTVEADPDCLLSEAGDMTYFRFALKNNLDEEYTLENLSLQGDLLGEPKLIARSIIINANDVLEFTLENVRIEEFAFDMDLSFQVTWRTTEYKKTESGDTEATVTDHIVAAPIRIERFMEPVMTLSCSPDVLLAREGDPITVTYTLINDTKFDMTNITLRDAGIPQPAVSLQKNVLNAGESMQATASFYMGASNLELEPSAQYTVRGVETKTSASQTVTVERVEVDLKMEVESYPATVEGTLFRITLMNNGTHPVTDIRLTDEIGTVIADGITIRSGAEKTFSYMVPSAVASSSVRYISFEATGVDSVGGQVSTKSLSAYELMPFVDSNQVRLKLAVSMANAVQNDDGSNRLKLLFEIRNESQVPIRNAVVTESDYFKGTVNEYATLPTGVTSFEKEFVVLSGTRSLTFVLTAVDPAQTQYASAPITLDLSPLTAPKPTNVPAIKPGKTVDTTGTIYDTDRYIRIFRMSALIVLALTLMFLLLSVIFHVAESNIRRWLPKEALTRPFGPRKTTTGPIQVKENRDTVHNQFGYLQPAKLRYMDRTDRIPAIGSEGAIEESIPSLQAPAIEGTKSVSVVIQRSTGTLRREGDITAVPIHKPRLRPVMISSDSTMPFAPVHEGQEEPPAVKESKETSAEASKKETAALTPRVIETKRAPRIVPKQKLEIIRVLQP